MPDARPRHRVWVDAFAITRCPVTTAEYRAYVEATGVAPLPSLADPRFGDPRQPVVGVSWHQAAAFCEWLTRETGHAAPAPHRGRVGAGRTRRAGRRPLRVGGRAARALVRPCGRRPRGAAHGRRRPRERVRAHGPRRRRPRVVPRLVRRGRVRAGAGTKPDWAPDRHAARLPRRRVASPGAVVPGGAPLEPPAPPRAHGLRPARRADPGSTVLRSPSGRASRRSRRDRGPAARMSESPGAGHAGRVALVTGGAAGIGRAEAIALAEAGADVAVLGHTDLAGAEETARRCRALGRRAVVVRADVRRSDEVRQRRGRGRPRSRTARHPRQQRGRPRRPPERAAPRAGRGHLAPHARLAPHGHVPLHEARGPAHGATALGPGDQHVVGARAHRRAAHARPLRRREGGRHRADPHRRARARPARRHRQRDLAGLRGDRAAGRDPPPGAPRHARPPDPRGPDRRRRRRSRRRSSSWPPTAPPS